MAISPKRRGNGERPRATKTTAAAKPTDLTPAPCGHLAQLDAIVESIDEGLIIADAEGNVLRMNRQALEIHEYASVEEVRRALPDFADTFEIRDLLGNPIPVEDWPLGRAVRGESFSDWQLRVLDKRTGREWIARYDGTPVRDDDGGIVCTVVTLRDITGQKNLEARLRQADERNRTILESITDGFLAIDHEFRYAYVNEAAAAFLDTTPQELIGKVVWEAFPQARRSRFYDEFTRAVEEKISVKFEEYYEPLRRWYECRCYPSEDGLTVFFTDTTERRQAREKLQDANERLQMQSEELEAANEELQTQQEELQSQNEELQTQTEELRLQADELTRLRREAEESARHSAWLARIPEENPNPVLRVGSDQTLLYANATSDELCSIWGPWDDSAVPPVVQNLVLAALADDRIVEEEVAFDSHVFLMTVAPAVEEGYANIYARDITARKRAEQAARESQEHLRRVVDSMFAFVGVMTPDGTLVEANQAAIEAAGITKDDVIGRKFWDCYWWNYDPAVQTQLRSACERAAKGESSRYDVAVRMADDAQMTIDFSLVPMRDDEGRITHLIPSAVDITDRKRTEEEVRSVSLFPEQNPSPVLRIAPDGTLLYANSAATDLLTASGWRTGERITDALYQSVKEAWTSGQAREVEFTCGSTTYSFTVAPIAPDRYVNLYARDITEHKRAEGELRRSESFHRQTLESIPGMVFTTRPDGYCDHQSRQWVDYTGVPLTEQLGDGWNQLLHPEDRARAFAAWRDAVEGRAPYDLEYRVRRHDGRYEWFRVIGRPIEDAEGNIARWFGVAMNIEGLKQAEQAVRESEERLRMALEGGGMGLWEWDVENDRSFWDERIYDLLDLDRSCPATSTIFFSHVDGWDREALEANIREAMAEGEEFQAEFRMLRTHTDPIWVASRGRIIRDESGKAVRMLGVLFDITPRKQMEDELRWMNEKLEEEVVAQTEELRDSVQQLQEEVSRRVAAEERLRRNSRMLEAFFRHTITPLVFLDRDFNFIRVNEAYAQAGGRTPDYFIGKNHFALYPSEENEAIFRKVVETKQPYRASARPFTYPDDPAKGTTYWNWLVTPLLDEEGQVENLVFNLEDVTDEQQAMHELERRARQLQKLTLELSQTEDRERKRLAEILHDDLQQQLAGTKFHLGILANRVKADEKAAEMAKLLDEMIKEAIEKSRSLSHELSPAVLYQSDLGETFDWLAEQVRTKHGLNVRVDGKGVILRSDPLKAFLYKAGQELLFNTIKHAKVSEARVRVRRFGQHVCLAVSDRGRGFDPDAIREATGLGLLSIRERVELLGGRMQIRSAAGMGSRFRITVPDGDGSSSSTERRRQRREDWSEGDGQAETQAEATETTYRIVVADDHEIVRQGLRALFDEEADMELVGEAANGREAVNVAYESKPDVVIMDVSMPLMSGDEATRQIKTHVPGTRVIALSMFAQGEMAEKMRRAGAEAYMLKTDPADELLAAIRTQ